MIFWKVGILAFLKRINMAKGLGEVIEEYLCVGGGGGVEVFLVKLQAYSLLFDWEMSSIWGDFRYSFF